MSGQMVTNPKPSARVRALAVLAVSCAGVAFAADAAAQNIIRHPEEWTPYRVELEPHFDMGLFGPPGAGTGTGLGGGFRVGIEIMHPGFVPTINDSVAIGFGIDVLHYWGSGVVPRGRCTRFSPGPGGTTVCTEVAQPGGPSNYSYLPVVAQWNFWLTPKWSVFGEPGLAIYWYDYRQIGVAPALDVGGRFHFSKRATLTMRLGYPTFTLGVSFLL